MTQGHDLGQGRGLAESEQGGVGVLRVGDLGGPPREAHLPAGALALCGVHTGEEAMS